MSLSARLSRPLLLLGALAVAGCGTTGIVPNLNISLLRLVNAAPSLPALDVTYGGTLLRSGLQPGTASSYLQVLASTARLVARPSGTTSAALVDTSLVLPTGIAQTIVFTGTPAAPRYLLLLDDPATGSPNRAALRLVHAATSGTAVDVYVTPIDQARAATPTVRALAVGRNSIYQSLPNGVYSVLVTPVGDTTTTLYSRDSLPLGVGNAATLVLADPATAGGPLGAILVADR